ncbi:MULTISPECIES: FecR domain-containing protein [unclassified Fibrobacter]|uniref:FecR family protein n=1 Tax=unclassified Fibrobacter TaxID=2634177 RepID=UPI000D799E93|nr:MULTISPECIES: FecR family protein [unclassified Fibrobacter]PWJ68201.1 FecR family protein [Fibrobacter sp. UWR4]PZW72559.1 FecR family protein [Fibrobacter sp. UWR1]
MVKKCLFPLICLSLAFTACNDPSEEFVKSNKSAARTAEKSAGVFEAKVHSSLGSSELRRAMSDAWKSLRVGQSVRDNDRVRTFAESEVVLKSFDGTVFVISEKSDVEFNAAFQDSVRGEVNVFIKNGNIQFDVQKQKKRQYNFGTGTATASIRGTAGFVGSLDGQLVASLKEGLVEVKDAKGNTSSIKENQTVLIAKSGEVKTFQLESSGSPALFATLSGLVEAGGLNNMDELEKSLQSFDAGYAAEKKKFVESLDFKAVSIPSKISKPSITLKAKLTPGVFVTIMGVTDTVPASGSYERTFTWDEAAAGEKRFIATCSNGFVEASCSTWNTEYVDLTPDEVPAENVEMDTLSKSDSPVKESVKTSAKAAVSKAKKVVKPSEPVFNLVINLPPSEGAEVLETDSLGRDTLETLKVSSGKQKINTDLNIILSGIGDDELAKIDTIFIFRDGQQEEFITDVAGLSYSRKISFSKNEIAKYEVAAKLKDGSYVCAYKTYIVD